MRCNAPFRKLELYAYRTGELGFFASPCGQSWVSRGESFPFVRNAEDLLHAWTGDYVTRLRNGGLCGPRCPHQIGQTPGYGVVEPLEYPHRLVYAGSLACNLACVTCRSYRIDDPLDRQQWALFCSMITPTVRAIKLNCSGEALYSPAIVDFLRSELRYPWLEKISLITNGVLFTEEMYNTFHHTIRKILTTVTVSVDACTAPVYEAVRRGAEFNTLSENLKFISRLRRSGTIKKLVLSFTISKLNQHELIDFCEWSKKYHPDGLILDLMNDWNRFPQHELDALLPSIALLEHRKTDIRRFKKDNPGIYVSTNFEV